MGGALAKCISPNAKPQRRVQIDRKPSLDQQFDNMPPPHEWDPATNPPPRGPVPAKGSTLDRDGDRRLPRRPEDAMVAMDQDGRQLKTKDGHLLPEPE